MIKKIALLFTFIIALNTTTSLHAQSDFTMYAVIFTMGILIGAVLMNIYLQTNTLNNHLDDSSQQKNSVSVSAEPKVFTIAHAMRDKWSLIIENSLKVTINITSDANRLETFSTEKLTLEASDTEIKIYRPATCIPNSFNTAKNKSLECSLYLTENDFNNIIKIHAFNKAHIAFDSSATNIPLPKLSTLIAENNTTIEKFSINTSQCDFSIKDNSNVTIKGKIKEYAPLKIANKSIFNAGELKDVYYFGASITKNSTAILHVKTMISSFILDNSCSVTINENAEYTNSFTQHSLLTFYDTVPPTLITAS